MNGGRIWHAASSPATHWYRLVSANGRQHDAPLQSALARLPHASAVPRTHMAASTVQHTEPVHSARGGTQLRRSPSMHIVTPETQQLLCSTLQTRPSPTHSLCRPGAQIVRTTSRMQHCEPVQRPRLEVHSFCERCVLQALMPRTQHLPRDHAMYAPWHAHSCPEVQIVDVLAPSATKSGPNGGAGPCAGKSAGAGAGAGAGARAVAGVGADRCANSASAARAQRHWRIPQNGAKRPNAVKVGWE